MAASESAITKRLVGAPGWLLILFAIGTSFTTYFCMYAFRKPFAAAEFAGQRWWRFDLKTVLVVSQMVGYTLSKYVGIKLVSEVSRARRAWSLVGLIAVAELALVLFAALPARYQFLAIFLNGLPLGMVWGLVVWYLEGRRASEVLLAGLSCSFIIASGVVKDVGRAFLQLGISESWMPAVTGVCFFPLFVVAVFFLDRLPEPSAADIAARAQRTPMKGPARREFVKRFFFGLLLLFAVYFFLTAYRDFRDSYGVEILRALGYAKTPAIFSMTEIPVAFGVMGALALLALIRDNRRGLIGAKALMVFGLVLMGGATLALDAGWFGSHAVWWMILVGLGSYLAYVPYGTVLFDRLIASTGAVGTAVFAIYVADALGYTGSIVVQLYKDLVHPSMSRFDFFRGLTYFLSVFGALGLIASAAYFLRRHVARPKSSG